MGIGQLMQTPRQDKSSLNVLDVEVYVPDLGRKNG